MAGYPETLPTIHAISDTGHTTDHNTIVTAVANIDARLFVVEYTAVRAVTANTTLVIADVGKCIEMTSASATTITVPPNSSVAFPIGTVVLVATFGAGTTTIVAGAGVTIDSYQSFVALAGINAGASLRKRGTDRWQLVGTLA